MDKILITGVAGFIGSNLALDLLENENNLVYGIDNFENSTMSNLYSLLRNRNFQFLENNLEDSIDIKADYVFHCIGSGDYYTYLDNKYTYILNKIESIKSIINFCKINGAKLLYIGTNKNYHQEYKEYFELYNMEKLIEDLVNLEIKDNKLSAKIAYLDYVYGKNYKKEDKRFIPNCIKKCMLDENIIEKNDESFYFTYIDDVIYYLKKLMFEYYNDDKYDISSNMQYLKSDIIKLIKSYTNSNSELTIESNNIISPNYMPNGAIVDELKNNSTSIEIGIKKTVEYFKLMYFS